MFYKYKETSEVISKYTLNTYNVKFKYPTTLSGFKKDINPVIALFERHQEFLHDTKNSSRKKWIISLMTNEFINDIIQAIDKDLLLLSEYNLIDHDGVYIAHRLQSIKSALVCYII